MSSDSKTIRASFQAQAPWPIRCLYGYGSYLYLGTAPDGTVMRTKDGFYYEEFWRTGRVSIEALAEFGGALFVGTSPDGQILMHNFNTGNRFHVVTSGDVAVSCLHVHDGMLFAGTSPSGLVLSFDGLTWRKEYDAYGAAVKSMASLSGGLYVFLDEAEVVPVRNSAGSWSTMVAAGQPFALPQFSAVKTTIAELAQNRGYDRSYGPSVVFKGKLYFAGGKRGALYSFDGSGVVRVFDAGTDLITCVFVAADQMFLGVGDALYVYEEEAQ